MKDLDHYKVKFNIRKKSIIKLYLNFTILRKGINNYNQPAKQNVTILLSSSLYLPEIVYCPQQQSPSFQKGCQQRTDCLCSVDNSNTSKVPRVATLPIQWLVRDIVDENLKSIEKSEIVYKAAFKQARRSQ